MLFQIQKRNPATRSNSPWKTVVHDGNPVEYVAPSREKALRMHGIGGAYKDGVAIATRSGKLFRAVKVKDDE